MDRLTKQGFGLSERAENVLFVAIVAFTLGILLLLIHAKSNGKSTGRKLGVVLSSIGCLIGSGGLAIWAYETTGMTSLVLWIAAVLVLIFPLGIWPLSGFHRPFWTNVPYLSWIIGPAIIITYLLLAEAYPADSFFGPTAPDWLRSTSNGIVALIAGSIAGIYGYMILAITFGFNSAKTADPRQFGELVKRAESLNQLIIRACPPPLPSGKRDCESARIQVNSISERLRDEDSRTTEQWITGAGYVNEWTAVHDVEANLFAFQPIEQVIANGKFDLRRIPGDKQFEGLKKDADNAIAALEKLASPPDATTKEQCTPEGVFLDLTQFVADLREAVACPEITKDRGEQPANPLTTEPPVGSATHRAFLGSVRRQINDVRDEARYGYVSTKQRVLVAGAVTSIILFIFLAIVILQQPPASQVVAGAVFFLSAALVGLFRELYNSSIELSSGEGDFQLARTRAINIPLLSGIAGIAGVIITAFFFFAVDGSALAPGDATSTAAPTITTSSDATPAETPIPVPTPTRTSEETDALVVAQQTQIASYEQEAHNANQRDDLPTFDAVFSLDENRIGIVIAALFGLTPSLLMSRLNASQYAETLRKSSGIQKD